MSTLEAQDTPYRTAQVNQGAISQKHWVMAIAFIIVLASILWVLKLIFYHLRLLKQTMRVWM